MKTDDELRERLRRASDWIRPLEDPLEGLIGRRALRRRRRETSVRMRCFRSGFFGNFRCPLIALPINALCRWLVGHAFPPDASFGSERHVGKDCVS